jgi:hypothetical protein
MSSSRAYANPKIGIVNTLLLYVISSVNIICINSQGNVKFAVYKLNMMNRNYIYTNGWPKITIWKPHLQSDRLAPLQYIFLKVQNRTPPITKCFHVEPLHRGSLKTIFRGVPQGPFLNWNGSAGVGTQKFLPGTFTSKSVKYLPDNGMESGLFYSSITRKGNCNISGFLTWYQFCCALNRVIQSNILRWYQTT